MLNSHTAHSSMLRFAGRLFFVATPVAIFVMMPALAASQSVNYAV